MWRFWADLVRLFQVGGNCLGVGAMQGVMQSQLWGGQLTGTFTSIGVRKQQDGYLGVRASAEREVKAKAVAAPPPALTEDRLVSRVQERDGYWVLKEEFHKGINPAEKVRVDQSGLNFSYRCSSWIDYNVVDLIVQIKLAKEPMKFFTENEIEELAKTPFAELDSTKPGKDDIDVRLKWLGLFHRRKHQCEYRKAYVLSIRSSSCGD